MSSEITPANELLSAVPPAPSIPRESQFNHPRLVPADCSSVRGLPGLERISLVDFTNDSCSCRSAIVL
uniref:Uncharacterized protein n=1 Tax=Arundo donax TaxID=35708 RepID=A0A0A8ZIW0_ARUDO